MLEKRRLLGQIQMPEGEVEGLAGLLKGVVVADNVVIDLYDNYMSNLNTMEYVK